MTRNYIFMGSEGREMHAFFHDNFHCREKHFCKSFKRSDKVYVLYTKFKYICIANFQNKEKVWYYQ